MLKLEVYEVALWDGGDRHKHEYYVMKENTTKEQLEKLHQYSHVSEKTIVVMHKPEEYADFKQEQLRQRALSKLTNSEKILLGLA
jgi:hypothetical protein